MKVFYILRAGVEKIRKKLCPHRWAYKKTVTLIGRRYAEYVCVKCGKAGHMRYDHDYEIKNVV